MNRIYVVNGQKPSLEQLKEVEEAAKHEINFEDCDELTPEMEKAIKCVINCRNRRKNV